MKFLIPLLLMTQFVTAEVFDVTISNFKFTPNNLTIKVGDTVRWTNVQGFHDVTEDNNNFSSGAASSSAFVFEHTFNSVEEVFYYCTVHSSPGRDINTFMNGRINVEESSMEPFAINQGIAGAWFFPETSGSGLLFDIRPSDKFAFVAWFTYDTQAAKNIGSSNARWFFAQGNYSNGKFENFSLKKTTGGVFDSTTEITNEEIGNISIEFTDCNSGVVTYNIDTENLSGSFPIQRVIPGSESLCEDLNTL